MKKWIKLGVCTLLLLFTAGCGTEQDTDAQMTTHIEIEKNGRIVHTIYENFTETYYHLDELEQMIQNSITDYQKADTDAQIELVSCAFADEQKQVVKVVMAYNDCEAYTGFNDRTLFFGTIQEAYEAGYDLDIELIKADDKELVTIGKNELLGMGTSHIVICDEDIEVRCYEQIQYIGSQMTLLNKKSVVMEQTQGNNAIVFK